MHLKLRSLLMHVSRHVSPSTTMKLQVWNWRKYSRKESSGSLGVASVPLAFLLDMESQRQYLSKRELVQDIDITNVLLLALFYVLISLLIVL